MSSNKHPENSNNTHPEKEQEYQQQFLRLVEIMKRLLGPAGCPWDREQTHQSLKPYLIEEAYEVIEGIDEEDFSALKEELGDLMLQIVFHAELARLDEHFDIGDVIRSIADKMEHRHPHVFGNEQWASSEEVLRNWEDIKKAEKEKKRDRERVSILDGIPRNLPALIRSHRIQDRAARVGFDWEEIGDVYEKVLEELEELKEMMAEQPKNLARVEDEFGDLLFALVNLSRFLQIHPEEALQHTNEKFIKRFQFIEGEVHRTGKDMKTMTLGELDAIWEQAKEQEENA